MSQNITLYTLNTSIKNIDSTVENLAIMIASGFEDTNTAINKLSKRVESLEDGQETIIMRLAEMAPYFEVKDLKRRVTKLEQKLKMN